MKQRFRARRAFGGTLVLAAAATVAALVAASAASAAAPATHPITVRPDISGPQVPLTTPVVHFGCQSRPISGSAGPRCYQANQIQHAYGYDGLLASGINGSGETIVIIDAYSNPYIPLDLQIQDQFNNLPAPPSFSVVSAPGHAPPAFDINDPNQVGWAEEITLDVLWAHAMAPNAKIVLAEAKSSDDAEILATTKYVVDNNLGDVISQSFGEAETCVDPALLAQEHAVFQQAVDQGQTLFASSGDSGAAQPSCDGKSAVFAASSPASDTNVTGVGGTTLNASDPAGNYLGETTWTEQLFGCNPPAVALADINCSGGGFSTLYGRPAWQQALVKGGMPHAGRGVPDVAYDAGVNGGVITHCAVCNLTIGAQPTDLFFFIFGGTSAGSPQWAALTADANQMAGHRLGNINQSLYQFAQAPPMYASGFHDVTVGNNNVAEIGTGYSAGPGWDPVTGLGTPNAAVLLPYLAKRN
jgi:subtilase family serine protease